MPDRTVNLLLISDNDEDIRNVQQAFEQNNLHNPLYVAADEPSALSVLRGNSAVTFPSYRRLILLDLGIACMNGMEFLRQLRADPELKMMPVVVLAPANQDSLKLEAYSLNAAGYILKPITFSKFADAMATLSTYWALSEMP